MIKSSIGDYMKKIKLFLLCLFIYSSLFSQEALVKIDLQQDINYNILESLNIYPIMHTSREMIFIIDDKDKLITSKIRYEILCEDINLNPLIIISSNNSKQLSQFIGTRKSLYHDIDQAIVNEHDYAKHDLKESGIKFQKVKKNNIVFKNIKQRYENHSKEINELQEEVLSAINADSIAYYIQALQNYQTRYALHPNRFEIADWIKEQFIQMGYINVVIDSFYHEEYQTWQKNVIAIKEGSEDTDQCVIIGAHYDSIQSLGEEASMLFAPGADDNASGCAAVLEIARAMKQVNFNNKVPIRFCTYAMEEFGLWGSKHDAEMAESNQLKIRAMINNDMIATQLSSDWVIHLKAYSSGQHLTDLAESLIEQEPNLNYLTSLINSSGSDSWSYWNKGYPALYLQEMDYSPYYHTSEDLFEHLNIQYAKKLIQIDASLLMKLSVIPSMPEDYQLFDPGSGKEILVTWKEISDLGSVSYQFQVKDLNTEETFHFTAMHSPFVLSGLRDNSEYSVSMYASIDSLASLVQERTIKISKTPRIVENLTAKPLYKKFQLKWTPSFGLDLQTYKIYRSSLDTENYQLISEIPVDQDSCFITPEDPYNFYQYVICCTDIDGNESEKSQAVKVKTYTFNEGILIIDDSYNGNGSLTMPNDEQIDSFYNNILSQYPHTQIDLSTISEDLDVYDLCPYSLILYHRNTLTNSDIVSLNSIFKSYLDNGGKLIISAYKVSQIFSNNPGYPHQFSSTQESDIFVKKYLKIKNSDLNNASRFQYAQSLSTSFSDIYCDTLKIHPALNGRLKSIEMINSEEDRIYSYQSGMTEDSSMSMMNGSNVAVLSLSDYKTLVLSFPLYFMKEEEARLLIDRTITLFGGLGYVENQNSIPLHELSNISNYPNPFNRHTNILLELDQPSTVSISIYNLKGQKVRQLCHQFFSEGYQIIEWDGNDDNHRLVASGIYFYQVKTDHSTKTKKMLFLK